MTMLSVGRVMEHSALTNATAPKATEQVSEKNTNTLASDSTDKFIKSGTSFTPAYTKAAVTDNRSGSSRNSTNADDNSANDYREKKAQEKKVGENGRVAVKSTIQNKNELMKDMVAKAISGQVNDSQKSSVMKELNEILNSYGLAEEAEKDPDFWSAEKTADRILDFAKNLAGDDTDKLETLRKAFEKGFSEVEGYFGGKDKLPSVSYDTYDRVQKGFDDWADEINAASENVALR